MPVNPYEPPHEPTHVAIPWTAQRTMFLLGLLSVPAGAIAGSVTCNAINASFHWAGYNRVEFWCIGAGVVVTLAIVVGALVYRRTRGTSVPDRQLPWLLAWTLSSQVLAVPIGALASYAIIAIAYSWHEGRWDMPIAFVWLVGSLTFFISAATAYWVWRGREQAWDKSATPNENEETP